MRLHALLAHFTPSLDLTTLPDVEITGIQDDSRLVQRGHLFVARTGSQTDGTRFAADAIQSGAAAILTQSPLANLSIPQIIVPDAAIAFSQLAEAFHGHPSKFVKMLGITGTNGKTTTAYLIRHILAASGQRCGMIGTVEIDDGVHRSEANMTTPGAGELSQLLSQMRENDCQACAIEVSSHALAQNRVAAIEFAGAGFINLTLDHLDYHQTMDQYAAAKARLFESLPASGVAAVNVDDAHHERMTRNTKARIVTFGIRESANYRATNFSVTAQGTTYTLHSRRGNAEIRLKLIGRHNIENSLCALVLCCEVMGLSVDQAAAALQSAAGAPGRLQLVPSNRHFAVLVDYAHTDDALQNVLTALRPLTHNKLRVVFGCGGDRDRSKRPRMARVAEELADAIYLTSDNPRTEDPAAILEEVAAGFTRRGEKLIAIEVDRRAAIRCAIHDAQEGDVVLIAGKGHENYQIIGKTKQHFDDVEEAASAMHLVTH
ncbi:MAG TPA: UDP-N-acetylmuramoyl-L-alanyl-D-glutamate--2,6-diaminopimelate ligase [Tepidisphaeraceae bacterium]